MEMTRFVLVLVLLATPAFAESHRYAVSMFGVRVGQMRLEVRAGTRDYALAARFRTTGVAGGMLARVRFDMTSAGRVNGPWLSPRSYSEDVDTGRRQSSANLRLGAGGDGRLDLLSAVWLGGLRDRPATLGCALDLRTFDGIRELRVSLRPAGESASTVTCRGGVVKRGAGYTAEELAQRRQFPIEATYRRVGEVLRFHQLKVHTVHGKASCARFDPAPIRGGYEDRSAH